MTQFAINLSNGVAFAITTRSGAACLDSITSGGGYYPSLGVFEIRSLDYDKKEQNA